MLSAVASGDDKEEELPVRITVHVAAGAADGAIAQRERVAAAVAALPCPAETAPEPQRNKPCPCGSNQKYKKCCGAGAPPAPGAAAAATAEHAEPAPPAAEAPPASAADAGGGSGDGADAAAARRKRKEEQATAKRQRCLDWKAKAEEQLRQMRDGVEQSLQVEKDSAEWKCRQCGRLNHFMDTVCGGGDIMFGLPMGCELPRNIAANAPIPSPAVTHVQGTQWQTVTVGAQPRMLSTSSGVSVEDAAPSKSDAARVRRQREQAAELLRRKHEQIEKDLEEKKQLRARMEKEEEEIRIKAEKKRQEIERELEKKKQEQQQAAREQLLAYMEQHAAATVAAPPAAPSGVLSQAYPSLLYPHHKWCNKQCGERCAGLEQGWRGDAVPPPAPVIAAPHVPAAEAASCAIISQLSVCSSGDDEECEC